MDGILLVDKPTGCTSHDVVAHARKALAQRDIGHAGTLDPMATGLLVVLAGEATKLSGYLTADSKRYATTIRFGTATDTLDADGAVIATSERAPPDESAIRAALDAMIGPMAQVPPAVSAIKLKGIALHERVRRGESVQPAPRDVVLESARVLAVREGECDLEIACSKGFYVRSLARDLAARLGDLAHLTALRRTNSGAFAVSEAIAGDTLVRAARHGDTSARDSVLKAVLPLRDASRALRSLTVTDDEAVLLGHGKLVPRAVDPDGTVLVLAPGSRLPVCIGRIDSGVLSVVRGFRERV
jgi:tRNA pseudouridine55 synthase